MRRPKQTRQRVVVFRTGQLGDTVCAIPAFRLLRQRFPDAELVLICDRSLKGAIAADEVVRPFKIFDRIETYAARRGWRTTLELAARVFRLRPQVVIILAQDSETPRSIARKSRFFRLLGSRDVRSAWIPIASDDERPNEADRLIALLNRVGIAGAKPSYDFPIDPGGQTN